ncbi:putative 1-aminocyclopropane-1-carboxylate oxidase-like protein [Sesbania bispinosa]|nr:putative 1-aminocyclopropane-1-carboxylate oxidase-like protein [Sesbania bispinosa]
MSSPITTTPSPSLAAHSTPLPYDRAKAVKEFDESKAGVKASSTPASKPSLLSSFTHPKPYPTSLPDPEPNLKFQQLTSPP